MVLTGLQRREKAGAQILTSPRVLGMYFCPHSSWVCLLWLLGIEGLTISIWCTGLLKLWLQFSPEMHGDVCGIWFRSDIISVSALPWLPDWLSLVDIFLLLQNDLIHGWGLDFALRKCVEVRTSQHVNTLKRFSDCFSCWPLITPFLLFA